MDVFGYMVGVVDAQITTADPEGLFAALNQRGIELKALTQVSDLTYRFCVSRRQYRAVEACCEKRGASIQIRGKRGLYWQLVQAASRPILSLGALGLITLVLWIPTRVFFIQVEGNALVPAARILDAAEGCGISFGASRRQVRSEKVKNALLSAVPQLQWAGVNTSGCTATITVREKAEPEAVPERPCPASVVAARDGYILGATAQRGNLLVAPGQTVLEDQVLISAYTDCGLSIRAEQAQGEILAQTRRSLEAVMPDQVLQKQETGKTKRRWSLLVRKKRIFLWKDSGIWDASCGRMYKEYNIILPGGFVLPVALCLETYRPYETVRQIRTGEEALKSFLRDCLSRQMIAGKILTEEVSFSQEEGLCRLTGEYTCVEMIGKLRQEQIGDTNGKDN